MYMYCLYAHILYILIHAYMCICIHVFLQMWHPHIHVCTHTHTHTADKTSFVHTSITTHNPQPITTTHTSFPPTPDTPQHPQPHHGPPDPPPARQAAAPLFRPVATDVKGGRGFIATIARRLDSLGAITRGQRDSQTAMGGDATLFRESDNLESLYAKAALRQFYMALWRGAIDGWSLADFEEATGLKLVYEGTLKEELLPMSRFLNRLLALPIAEQNQL